MADLADRTEFAPLLVCNTPYGADVTPKKFSPHLHELLFTVTVQSFVVISITQSFVNTFFAIGLFCPSPRLPAQVIRVHGHYVWADSHGLQNNRTGNVDCK